MATWLTPVSSIWASLAHRRPLERALVGHARLYHPQSRSARTRFGLPSGASVREARQGISGPPHPSRADPKPLKGPIGLGVTGCRAVVLVHPAPEGSGGGQFGDGLELVAVS